VIAKGGNLTGVQAAVVIMKGMHRAAFVIPFLALSLAQAQDLPAGKGKDLLEKICAECHGLDIIASQHATKDGWASIVDSMVGRGASGTKEELDTIVDYLAKNFGPEEKKLKEVRVGPIAPARAAR
jgi:mono/diheme cytochrome c family protein